MNLPNKLTVLRICMVPVFIVVMMLPASVLNPIVSGLIGVALFIAASFTDMLDGKIARKYGLVTDFGTLMDPLADKFMVIGALAVIVYRAATPALRLFFTLVLLVVIFRELAVTSLRLVASTSSGAVVAANMLGKIKTVMQIVFVSTVFIEPALYAIPALKNLLPEWWIVNVPLSYVTGALTLLFTVWSGVNYFIGMWKYLDPEK
ncbi:MAG: CDP-diacylglycerol--glycerol-3-phosphate 3-phosphatidyltransferase [Clostridia bacterium]|nr:CDP-diacylglycerol--glycerol-3-phosphate 3-phosphatidyltransferase [Clostridia bacterium]